MKVHHIGGCQCKRIRYLLDGEVIRLNVCHCQDCQLQSGSAFGMSLVIPHEGTFQLTSGQLKTFETVADSGRKKTCAFCGDCGVRIYNATSALKSIKAGTLDDTAWLAPDAHYWTKNKQPWVGLPGDVPCYDDYQ
ncbi:MAG: GFA family protein [Pseudomonadota bacterium]